MKKQTENNIFTHRTPHAPHTPHTPLFKYTYTKYAYTLATCIIITLTLSHAHTKTTYDPYFQDPAHGSAATKNLHRAAHTGNIELAREAIREHADLNVKGQMYWTALMHASYKGHTEIVQLLLEHHAQVNIKSKEGDTALILAMHKGHPEIVRLLLTYTEPTEVLVAAKKAATKKLRSAAHTGNIELAHEALREQADINARDGIGWTPLMQASDEGHIAIVHLLLEHKAHMNIKSPDGDTALIIAAKKDHTEIARLLLEHNANTNIKGNSGYTALITAAYRGHTDTMHLLLEHNADTDIQTDYGSTALLMQSNSSIMETLILHGADVTIANKRKKTALNSSSSERQKVITQSIKKRLALEKELDQQDWDLEISSLSDILQQFTIPDTISLICAYANPYNETIEQPLLRAMKNYIRNNATRAQAAKSTFATAFRLKGTVARIPKPISAYALCCAESPDCSCATKIRKIKKTNTCALQ